MKHQCIVVRFPASAAVVSLLLRVQNDSGAYPPLYKYTVMYHSNTTQLYYVYYCAVQGQRVSILMESSLGPSKKQILTYKCLKCAVGS